MELAQIRFLKSHEAVEDDPRVTTGYSRYTHSLEVFPAYHVVVLGVAGSEGGRGGDHLFCHKLCAWAPSVHGAHQYYGAQVMCR